MNISINAQNPYSAYMPKTGRGGGEPLRGNALPSASASVPGVANDRAKMMGYTDKAGQPEMEEMTLSKQMKQLLRDLRKTPKKEANPFAGTSEDKVQGLWDPSDSKDDEEEETAKPVNYNCKEVETKIQRAKTSQSAGQAVISAKRKVLEVRRKIASSDGDSDQLQLALTHARRMEMVARKKKHHLELEEMVQTTGKRDERQKKQEEASTQLKNALVTAQEEKITKREDAVFEERQKQISEFAERIQESGAAGAEDMLSELNKMLADFGEEELKELEEAMEMLEDLEVVDPHMSKEDLEALKRKHRAAEQKAMVKADMDYLKGMVKLQTRQSTPAPAGSAPAGSFSAASIGIPQLSTPALPSFQASGAVGSAGIDVQV